MDIEKFSVSEMLSNSSNGKTSAGKVVGTYLIAIASVMLIAGSIATFTSLPIDRLSLLFYTASGITAAGSALMLGKVLSPTKEKDHTNEAEIK